MNSLTDRPAVYKQITQQAVSNILPGGQQSATHLEPLADCWRSSLMSLDSGKLHRGALKAAKHLAHSLLAKASHYLVKVGRFSESGTCPDPAGHSRIWWDCGIHV